MPEKINIATLQIDFSQVIKKSAEYKKQIDDLKKSQKELDVTTETGRKAYAKMDVEIKNLNKSYRDNQSFARALDNANEDLNKTMSTQNKSTQELRDSRAQLNQISKQLGRNEGELTGNLEEELALREQLNAAIDEQTEALREQSSEFNSSKDQIGEYEQGITAAFDKLNLMNGGIGGFVQRSQEAGGTGKLFSSALGDMTKGMFGMVKASLAFIATPIGAILAVLVGAFLLVKNAMNRSEESTNKIKKAFAAFGGIIQGLLKILEPLGDFLIDGLVKGFELVEKGVFKALDAIAKGLDYLGFDEQAESVRNFTSEIEESAEAAKRLAQAEIEFDKAQRIARKTQLEFQKDAEKLRQIRDDESKTIAERVQANEELGGVLKEQLKIESALAQKALEVANARILLEGETKEALDAQAEALTEIADIQERITGQESEQLVNLNSLRKEAADKQKKIQEDAIKKQNEELDLFIKQQGIRAKTLEEGLEQERKIAAKKIEILDAELEAKLISQEKYDAEVLDLQNNLLRSQAELSVENARLELEAYNEKNRSKLDSDKFLTEQLFTEEQRRLEGLAEQRRQFEATRLEEGLISQSEYNAAINAINEENRIANEALETERKEAKKEQDAIDYENKLALELENNANEYEVLTAQLEADRQAEVKAAEKTGADVELINKKYVARQKKIDEINKENQLTIAEDTFGNLSQLLGEHTAAGKAAGIAQATINTYQGITEVWKAPSVLPEPFNTASKVVATGVTLASGLGAVKKITSTPTKFALGEILDGASHANGGIPFSIGGRLGFEAEGGEALINKKSTSMFAPLLSAINVAGGGKKFANGDILGTSKIPSSFINYDTMAEKLAEANASLPAPVVSVEEFTSVANEVDVIESDASFS